LASRNATTMEQVTMLPTNMSEELRIQAQIELRAPRCLNSQSQLRNEEIACTRRDTTLETTVNVKAYEMTKQQSLSENRITTRGEGIKEEQSNNELLRDRTLKTQLITEELTAANYKPERSEKNVAAKIENTKIDPETPMQKVTELEKTQKNFDKVLTEEE
jgi:SWI/SNF-related matrix-associated actin-dependent regulator of chromatin subfamily A protein 2/4